MTNLSIVTAYQRSKAEAAALHEEGKVTPNVCCLEKKNAPRLSNLKGGSEHGVVWLSAPAHARRDAQAIVTGARLTDPGRC